jgi:hypothetical protein
VAKPLSPRSLRGDAMFDLAAQYEELLAAYDLIEGLEKSFGHEIDHLKKRISNAAKYRYAAIGSLNAADDAEQQMISLETVAA